MYRAFAAIGTVASVKAFIAKVGFRTLGLRDIWVSVCTSFESFHSSPSCLKRGDSSTRWRFASGHLIYKWNCLIANPWYLKEWSANKGGLRPARVVQVSKNRSPSRKSLKSRLFRQSPAAGSLSQVARYDVPALLGIRHDHQTFRDMATMAVALTAKPPCIRATLGWFGQHPFSHREKHCTPKSQIYHFSIDSRGSCVIPVTVSTLHCHKDDLRFLFR